MKIYTLPFCPFCYRVKLAIKIKNISKSDVQIEDIDISSPPNGLKKINPALSVPTLELNDGSGFTESMIIVNYLDSTFKSEKIKIYPENKEEYAKIKCLVEKTTQEINPFLLNCILSNKNEVKLQKSLDEVIQVFNKLEMLLEKNNNSPYFGGNEFNAVDISLAPFICYYFSAQKINSKYPLPNSNSKSLKYINNILNNHTINEVILCDNNFTTKLNELMSESTDIMLIKKSSRTIIEDLETAINNLNKNITLHINERHFNKWKLNKNLKGNYIESIFEFNNSEEAILAIQKIYDLQETTDHHANFVLENFNRLKVEICTHQPKWGVTQMDISFAEILSKLILN